MREYKNITFLELYNKIKVNIKNTEELANIKKAYYYALEKHKGMVRLNGDDFIIHPLTVANILNDLNVDSITLEAGLLHEVFNHNLATYQDIVDKFGETVANIIESYTKINKLELTDESLNSAIYLRKVLVGLSTDVRVLFIKLADRLHNMRTNYATNKDKQKSKAIETINVLIPIAHRLGINSIKSELEDLCLYYTKRDVYEDILKRLNETKKELNSSLEEMKESITNILTEQDLTFEIKGRVKSVNSIYNKLSKGRDWSEIYDILALRVILEDVNDCYMAVGLVHAKYRPIPKRFKDYIAMPKANMYQSLHTTIYGVDGHLFEIQFRTYEMDEFAEKGMASHWSYKEAGTKKVQYLMEQKLEMFRNLIESQAESDDITFKDMIKSEVLSEMIYVYTPKGDVIELPQGATAIDFAYRIHSDIGNKTVGAFVNDKITPLNYELQNNDIVKIKTSSNATPNKDWLNFVKTTQAKNKIKAYFSKQDKNEMIFRGKDILEKELRKRKLRFLDVLNEKSIKKIIKDLKLSNLDDIYFGIGTFRFTASYIISLTSISKENISDTFRTKNNFNIENKALKNDIIVAGVDDILVNLGKCCRPIKGDSIKGYITKGQGITVHRDDCLNINKDEKRIIDVKWNFSNKSYYNTSIWIEVLNDSDYLPDILAVFTKEDINVNDYKVNKGDNVIIEINIKVDSLDLVLSIKNKLENLRFVIKVWR